MGGEKSSGTKFLMKVHLVFWGSEGFGKEESDPEWQNWEWGDRSERWGEGLDLGAHPGAKRGPSSGSLLSLVRRIGDVGPEEPLIPLRVGGEPRPNLGLACGQGVG